jgi:GT2 family glycosyltransferase
MTKDKKSVAILVLNYNGEKYLERFFCFLKKQNLEYCDVYFVENGSKDESLEIAKKFIEQDKIIINKKNVGISGGFNSGLSRIIDKYEYIILLANDILVGDRWLENLMKPILEDKKNGISTSVVLQENGKIIEIGGICLFNIFLGVFGHYLGFHKYDYFEKNNINKPFKVAFSAMASMVIRSSILKELGLFDETFWEMFMDIDLSWRVRLMGYDIVCVPNSFGVHIGETRYTVEKASNLELGLLFLYYKFLDGFHLFLYFPIMIMSRLGLSIIYIFISREIAIKKIKNIFYFLFNIGKYRNIRKKIQSSRKITDREIFKDNNISIFTFRFPTSLRNHKILAEKGFKYDLKYGK